MFGMGGGDGYEYQDPTVEAQGYLNRIPGEVTPYYQPYIDWGMQSGDYLSDYYGGMINDPQGYYNNIMMGYEPSASYQYQQGQLEQQMAGNAAAGGFTGTTYDQQQQADATQKLIARDQQQYFDNIYGIQGAGAQGEQKFFDTGYGASTGLADILGENLAQQAGLSYKGVADENQLALGKHNAKSQLMGSLAGAGAKLGSSYLMYLAMAA